MLVTHARYSDQQIKKIACALNDDGVFVAQIGENPVQMSDLSDARPGGNNKEYAFKGEIIAKIAKHFTHYGTFVYSAYVPSFGGPWAYVLACKSPACAQRWHSNAAAVNLAKHQRLLPGALHQVGFDGSSQLGIQQTPLVWQHIFCSHMHHKGKTNPTCQWLNTPNTEDGNTGKPEAHLAVRPSTIDQADNSTRNELVTTRDIPKGTEFGLFDAATAMEISRTDFEALLVYAEKHNSPEYKNLVAWMHRYGFSCDAVKGGSFYVSLLSLLTFTNHGCGDLANLDGRLGNFDDDEMNDDSNKEGGNLGAADWDPPVIRHARQHCMSSRSTRLITKGTSLLEDYSTFDWADKSMDRVGKEVNVWCNSTATTTKPKKVPVLKK
jgi:hypothetical protein